ncbi:heterokaryon incompatibility protein-domain-containing protein [Tricladium varicosporioides]|nr:heterokaryon incompatibility protein-domain-containing protein [Hymenoscyphus varicosporioides]
MLERTRTFFHKPHLHKHHEEPEPFGLHFQYRPLDTRRRKIRLLHVAPGAPADPLFCSLEHVSLLDKPTYTALSYRWGGPLKNIHIGDCIFKVTSNLEAALRQIRGRERAITLWVDAICINQDDKNGEDKQAAKEKSQQVAMMGEIYSTASKVFVWLGPASEDSYLAMMKIGEAGRIALESHLRIIHETDQKRWVPMLNEDPGMCAGLDQLLRGGTGGPGLSIGGKDSTFPLQPIKGLMARDWWSRIWVIQELALAQEADFGCGNAVVPAYEFCAGLNLFGIYRAIIIWQAATKGVKYGSGPSEELADIDLRPFRMIEGYRCPEKKPLYDLVRKTSTSASLLEGNIEATDPRDKIFALWGLASDAEEQEFQPDYDKSCTDVYTEAALAFIRAGHMDIFSMCQGMPQSPELLHLPSWVPDFSTRKLTPIRAGYMPHFCASRSFPGVPNLSVRADCNGRTTTLQMNGQIVDRVMTCSSRWSNLDNEYGSTRVYLQNMKAVVGTASPAYRNPEELEEALWRTPIADIMPTDPSGRNWTRASEDTKHAYLAIMGGFAWGQLGTLESQYHHRIATLKECVPFVTEAGYLGIGPSNIEVDDWIVILQGVELPLALRRKENGRYRLLGESYVHGIMDGEAFEYPGICNIEMIELD